MGSSRPGCLPANLPECHTPLLDWMQACVPSGERTAQAQYGARGWVVMHHVSDIFACTAAMDGIWGVWPMGAAWLAQHPWEHYAFLRILPAIPAAWMDGSVSGLRARGGFTVSIRWRKGTMASAETVPDRDGDCRLRAPGALTVSCAGRPVGCTVEGDVLRIPVRAGRTYEVRTP